jgi:hypothetical protein
MGWPPDVAYAADVNVLRIAREGRTDMFAAIFGRANDDDDRPRRPATPAALRSFARDHNTLWRSGRMNKPTKRKQP